MSRVAFIEELYLPIEFDAPQVQVRLTRQDWNKLCKFIELVPLAINENKYAPDDEVGIFILKEQATGKAPDVVSYIQSANSDAAPLWYSPFPYDPASCKECGSKEATSYPEHLNAIYCEACAQVVQMRKDAMTEQLVWAREWHKKGLEFDDLLAIAQGSVSTVASVLNSQPAESEAQMAGEPARPRIVTYGNTEHALSLLLEMPDGSSATHTFVLPDAVPAPGEYQLANYAVVGPRSEGNKRDFMLILSRDGKDYTASYSVDDVNRFRWFILPFFRPL